MKGHFMPPYRKPGEVNWTPTKYDECFVKLTGHPYRHQEGSGRAAALALVTDGVKVGDLTKLAAQHGFDSGFVVGSLLKQMGAKDHAFDIVAPEGTTLDAIKATRQERALSPEQEAARQAKLEAAEAKKRERAAAAEAKAAERAEAKAKADEERRARKEAAAEAAAKAKAEAAAKAAEGGGDGTTAPAANLPKKGKGKPKAAAAQPEGEQPAA
jgi:hypothetical protein